MDITILYDKVENQDAVANVFNVIGYRWENISDKENTILHVSISRLDYRNGVDILALDKCSFILIDKPTIIGNLHDGIHEIVAITKGSGDIYHMQIKLGVS